jgi:NitT/TauT family transport system substrate-binding protein
MKRRTFVFSAAMSCVASTTCALAQTAVDSTSHGSTFPAAQPVYPAAPPAAGPLPGASGSVRIGAIAVQDVSPAVVAIQSGALGANANFAFFGNGAAALAAVAGGALDLAYANVLAIATAHQRGIPFVIVAPGPLYQSNTPASETAVAQNSPLRTARDLNGKTIGVTSISGLEQLGLMAWIDRNGGDSKTVKFVELPYPLMATALEQGRIDAAAMGELFLQSAGTGIRPFASTLDGIAPSFMIGAWIATVDFASRNAAVVQRFQAAIERTGGQINANPSAYVTTIADFTKLQPALVQRMLFATSLDTSTIQPVCDVAVRYGVLSTPIDARTLLWSGR